jgi:hypothetical protein
MTNNAAAGSDKQAGHGIWYLFPEEPVGPSQGLGFFDRREAKRTLITLFEVLNCFVLKIIICIVYIFF